MTMKDVLEYLPYNSIEELIEVFDEIPTRAEKLMYANEIIFENIAIEEDKKDDAYIVIYGQVLGRE